MRSDAGGADVAISKRYIRPTKLLKVLRCKMKFLKFCNLDIPELSRNFGEKKLNLRSVLGGN